MNNLTHFIQIGLDDVNALGITGRVLFRLHGFLSSRTGVALAVDFPEWKDPSSFMSAGLGRSVRIFGSRDHLAEFLSKTGLIQFLIEGGIVVSGIKPVPEGITEFVQVQRSYAIGRLTDLLNDTSRIKFEETEVVDDYYISLAKEQSVSPVLLSKIDSLMTRLHQEKRATASVKVHSESSGRPFIMNIRRTKVDGSSASGRYSSYGLSLDGAFVPSW